MGLGQDTCRSAMAATDVCHPGACLEACLDAFQRRKPAADQIGRLTGPEEALGPVKQRGVVLMPAQARTCSHRLHHLGNRLELRHCDLKRTWDEVG